MTEPTTRTDSIRSWQPYRRSRPLLDALGGLEEGPRGCGTDDRARPALQQPLQAPWWDHQRLRRLHHWPPPRTPHRPATRHHQPHGCSRPSSGKRRETAKQFASVRHSPSSRVPVCGCAAKRRSADLERVWARVRQECYRSGSLDRGWALGLGAVVVVAGFGSASAVRHVAPTSLAVSGLIVEEPIA